MRTRLLLAITVTLALAAPPAAAQEEASTISVTGTASLTADNDTASFGLGVSVRRSTPNVALRAASARMQQVVAATREAGVEEEDIRTTHVGVRRSYRRGVRRVTAYVASNRVRVDVRAVARAGRVIDAAVAAGATSVNGPDFSFSGTRGLYRDALAAAFEDARDKARAVAERAGMTLGRARSIEESANVYEQPAQPQSVGVEGDRGAPTPVLPGETGIDAVVGVVFEAR